MGSGGGGTNTVQTIPSEFKPFYTDLFKGSRAAALQSALGSQGAGQTFPGFQGFNFGPGIQTGGFPALNFGGGSLNVPAFQFGGSPTSPGFQTGHAQGQRGQGGAFQPAPGQQFLVDLPTNLFGGGDGGEDDVGTQTLGFTFTQDGQLVPTGVPGIRSGLGGGRGPADFSRFLSTNEPASALVGSPFSGPFNAPANPLESLGLLQRAGLGQQLQGFDVPLLNLALNQASGQFLDPSTNPALQGAIDSAVRPVRQQFEEQIRPAARSEAIASGAYKGSSRRDLLESTLARDFEQAVGDISQEIVFNNYLQERQLQQNAGQLLDQAARLAQLPPELLLQAGAGFRGLEQIGLDEGLAQFQEAVTAPFRPLFPFASIIQGGDIGRNTFTSGPSTGGLGGGIQGALGGLGIGAGLADTLGLSGGSQLAALGIPALLGGLGGAFG